MEQDLSITVKLPLYNGASEAGIKEIALSEQECLKLIDKHTNEKKDFDYLLNEYAAYHGLISLEQDYKNLIGMMVAYQYGLSEADRALFLSHPRQKGESSLNWLGRVKDVKREDIRQRGINTNLLITFISFGWYSNRPPSEQELDMIMEEECALAYLMRHKPQEVIRQKWHNHCMQFVKAEDEDLEHWARRVCLAFQVEVFDASLFELNVSLNRFKQCINAALIKKYIVKT